MEDLDIHEILFFLPLVSLCREERCHSQRTFRFHRGRSHGSPRFLFSAEYSRLYVILLQNCHKHNSSLQFHCKILTGMIVGSMSQSTVCRDLMWSVQGGEVHDTEISSSHGTVGKRFTITHR